MSIWDGVPRTHVLENGGGRNTDYSGLHKWARPGVSNVVAGRDAAQAHLEKTLRERLSLGENFDGFMAECLVWGATMYVVQHHEYGVCGFYESFRMHPPDRMEVYSDGGVNRLHIERTKFFKDISTAPLHEDVLGGISRCL